MKTFRSLTVATLMVALATAASAQQPAVRTAADSGSKTDSASGSVVAVSLIRPLAIDHIRPNDQRGVNVFEPTKQSEVPFNGFALSFGGAFTQEYQGLLHNNSAAAVTNAQGVNTNQLITIGHGFNNAVANLYVNAQLAPGIRVAMTSYLSSRHHEETWVKDGYLLIDDSPIDNPLLKSIMKYTTLRVGHFEINYGDEHFRRSDNGNSMDNAFIGNPILDAFTTEIGAEAYVRADGFLAMLGATGGEVHGQVTAPQARTLSVLGKAGFDKQLDENIRVRLTGSFYANNRAASNTLFTGDRGGSPYFDVLENTLSTETTNAWSGEIHPGFSNKVNAEVVNPFVKIGGFEFFGEDQTATGGASTEAHLRTLHQQIAEGLYRFCHNDFYVGARYNEVEGELVPNTLTHETVDRYQLGGGWFVTPNVLAKAEWVNQTYNNFPTTNILNGGMFKGFMVSGVVAF